MDRVQAVKDLPDAAAIARLQTMIAEMREAVNVAIGINIDMIRKAYPDVTSAACVEARLQPTSASAPFQRTT